jgi:hypothetical protein
MTLMASEAAFGETEEVTDESDFLYAAAVSMLFFLLLCVSSEPASSRV